MTLPPEGDAFDPNELAADEELVVFRIVRTGDLSAEEFSDSFRSHAELGIPPRGPETTHPSIYDGISVYDTAEAAVATAQKFPRIGRYVAEMHLRAESGARYLRWGVRGHLTVWGDPIKLAETTVGTISVD